MKLIMSVLLLCAVSQIHGQEQKTPAEQVAWRIANKMADTLRLNDQIRTKLFEANLDLWKKKAEARTKSADRAIVGPALQQVEQTRDSAYKSILPEAEYELYQKKKSNLVSNN